MKIELKITNGRALRHLEELKKEDLDEALVKLNREYAPVILETIKKNASGRPGPEVITGKYRDSIKIKKVTADGMAFGSNHPAAARLEYGFVGRDSLGREVVAPPYPHFRPAIQVWQRAWKNALGRTAARIVRKK
jgi:Bacteriophage HK97-gp10, putative tail-component